VCRGFVSCDWELSDDGSFCSRERSDVALSSKLLQVRCDQPSMTTALYPDLVQIRREARVRCRNVHQPGHDQRVPCDIRQQSQIDDGEHQVSIYCTWTALLMVPVVVFGGNIPTNALSKSPRSKFTAPRPAFGGASNCQHSRRAVLFAAEMAVMLKAAAWLATSPTKASTVAT
jgi:hypothetical protein